MANIKAPVKHWHKCCVYECQVQFECECDMRGEVPMPRQCCDEHQPMFDACLAAIGGDGPIR